MRIQRISIGFVLCLLFVYQAALARPQDPDIIRNGGFEAGLSSWQPHGEVHLDTNTPLDGTTSLRIGPGPGSVSQRIPVRPDNHMMVSAVLRSFPVEMGNLTIRFLDQQGNELMRLNSDKDMKNNGNPRKIEDYLKPHPLTATVEIIISKDSPGGYVEADQVGLTVYQDNDPALKTTVDLADVMKPIWAGSTVSKEAVLMLSTGGKPAMGHADVHAKAYLVRDGL